MPLIAGAEPFLAHGDRLRILVLHGVGGSPVSVTSWAQHLAHAGHTVAAPATWAWDPLAGPEPHTLAGLGEEADRNYAWLTRRSDTVVVMGLSNGATLGLRLAERHLDLAGLVLVNPQVHTERLDPPVTWRALPGAGVPAAVNDIRSLESTREPTTAHHCTQLTRPSRCGRA